MLRHRRLLLLLSVLLVGGSLAWTGYHGLRMQSESYRAEMEEGIAAFFGLPCDLGAIRAQTFESRAFDDIRLWLPDRRDLVFSCDRAIWHEIERDGEEQNELDLLDGRLVLGTDRWQKGDYRQVFESGLGHDFDDLRLAQVRMHDFEIAFDRGDVTIHCRHTGGTIDMTDPEDGVAHLVAYELNGNRISQGVWIDARFLPTKGVDVREFILTLPEVPLGCIGVSGALGRDIVSGRFAGQIQYRKPEGVDQKAEIWISGQLRNVDLSELTEGLPLGPLVGCFSMEVDWVKMVGPMMTHFRGRGRLTDFSLEPFAPLLGEERLSGVATFDVDPVDVALGHINRLRLDGRVSGVSLEEILHAWGRGSASGQLAIRINNLDIVDDGIKAADIEVSVLPPEDMPGTIDRSLLLAVAEGALDFTWPSAVPTDWLPERIEYVELGMRLLVQDNQLRILGTHGKHHDTILTVKIAGVPIGVVKEQAKVIDLSTFMADLFNRIRTYDSNQLREWWKTQPGRVSLPVSK